MDFTEDLVHTDKSTLSVNQDLWEEVDETEVE
jgi:hypothetical protein